MIPGSPLDAGRGWRIWYSRPGTAAFRPPAATVTRGDLVEATREEWNLLAPLAGLDRRMGVLTITLDHPHPGGEYRIGVNEPGVPEFRWRSLPDALPEEGVSFLVASCFWHENDKEGHYAAALRALRPPWQPVFKLLVGDQVYLDWPPELSLDLIGARAVPMQAARYEAYWGDEKYREALGTSPNFFLCDDHEFWNDYPERQIHLRRTWDDVRERYGAAAQALYERFQRCNNPGGARWYSFRIGPVSFFAADTRSERDRYRPDGAAHFIQEPQWQDLERWARSLTGPGILVLGQPIFQKDGDWRDHSLSNFIDDYSRLWGIVEAAVEGGGADGRPHDVLVLSGDIHTGRLAVGRRPGKAVQELIASPASVIKPSGGGPSEPDYRFSVGRGAARRSWDVDGQPFLTQDGNVAVVRMRPGTNARVAMDVRLWRVRPHDGRSWWQKTLGARRPEGQFQFLLEKDDIELR